MIIKVLKKESSSYKRLESLNKYLEDKNIKLHITVHNGIIYNIGDCFYKYLIESECTDVIPPFFEGKYIECDEFGNTDYYQK